MSKGAERKRLVLKDENSTENETETETVHCELVFQGPGTLMALLPVALGILDDNVPAVREVLLVLPLLIGRIIRQRRRCNAEYDRQRDMT